MDKKYQSQVSFIFRGLAYYISPPRDFADIMRDPLHMIMYTSFILLTCAFFSKLWIEISGESPKDQVKRLRDQDMVIAGYRDSSLVIICF